MFAQIRYYTALQVITLSAFKESLTQSTCRLVFNCATWGNRKFCYFYKHADDILKSNCH